MAPDPGTITAERRADGQVRTMRATARAPAGEWLFERAGEVFGPVSGARVVALLDEGSIDGTTRVRRDGHEWTTLGSTPDLVPHLREKRARARLAQEARRSERRARWSATARWTAWTLLIGGVVVAVATAAAYLSTKRPWQARSALLADFGQGIRVSPVRVATSARHGAREIAVPDLRATRGAVAPGRSSEARRAPGPIPGGPAPRSKAPSGETLVATQWDGDRIEKTVAVHKDRLAACVRDEAERSPEFSGAIPIEFAVTNDGRVGELWIDEPRFRSGPLRDCLLAVLHAASFQPFAGQRPVVSLAFQVGPR